MPARPASWHGNGPAMVEAHPLSWPSPRRVDEGEPCGCTGPPAVLHVTAWLRRDLGKTEE
jgi:hypothetical protein